MSKRKVDNHRVYEAKPATTRCVFDLPDRLRPRRNCPAPWNGLDKPWARGCRRANALTTSCD